MPTMNRLSTMNSKRDLAFDMATPRAESEHTAQRLALVAMRQWEKAATGIIALPAAAALSTAAAAMFGVTLLERVFETVEGAVADIGRRVSDDVVGEMEASGSLRGSREMGNEARS